MMFKQGFPFLAAALLALGLSAGCKDKDSSSTDDSGGAVDSEDTGEPDVTTDDTGAETDDFHDPLSRPEEPTLDIANFNSAGDCETCHSTHVQQWGGSMHAYAMVDPVFRELVKIRQADFNGEQDQFCTSCHTPVGTRGGDIVDNFSFETLDPLSLEGVTCETCHKATHVERPYNSGLVLDEESPLLAGISDPESNAYHESAASDVQGSSELCGACHDVLEVSGLNLERPYAEWVESPAGREGRSCQTCHMPTYEGQAADDSPTREVHDHTFIGVDLPLEEEFLASLDPKDVEARRAKIQALLDTAASMYLEADGEVAVGEQLDLLVTVLNEIDAHNLPTGTTFIRQLWVEITATDATGAVLYQSGDLDSNGDLRDYWSDEDPYGDDDLLVLHSGLVDDRGNPTIFTWRAQEHFSSSLSPLYDRTWTLFVPVPEDAVGPISIESRLLFRTHGPYLMRALGLDQYIDQLEIYELADDVIEVQVTGGPGPGDGGGDDTGMPGDGGPPGGDDTGSPGDGGPPGGGDTGDLPPGGGGPPGGDTGK
jgi:hypothetical protein